MHGTPGHGYSQALRRITGLGLLLLAACSEPASPELLQHMAAEPIRIVVSPEVRAQYRKSHRWDDKSINEWEQATLQVGEEPPTSCLLHARGKTTKRFARKSYTVKLASKQRVLPGKKLRRLFLLNLGFDPHQFELRFAYSCLSDLGLFLPRNRLVKLFVNDEPEGLYMVCDRHENAIRGTYPDTVAILRCKNDSYPLTWTAKNVDGSRAVTQLVAAMQLDDVAQRAAAFDEIIDVDALVTWMACNSLMQNSDCSGELFLFERRKPDQTIGRFGVMAWDYDDLMQPPSHPEAVMAHPLTWATEMDIEKTVLTTEPLSIRFHKALRRLLTEQLTQHAAESRLAGLRLALDAADPDGAKERGVAMTEFAASLQARREQLLEHLSHH